MSLYLDLVRYRDLFLNLLRRDLQVRYRGSFLGLAWTFVNPLALVGVYTLVFNTLYGKSSIPHYPLFVCTGLVIWTFFAASLTWAASSLVGQAYLVQQVRFPRQLLTFSATSTNFVTFLAMLVVLVPINFVFVPESRTTFWAGLLMTVVLLAIVLGLSLIIASVTVRFRDIEHLLQTLLLPWFFLTPIFYTFDTLPGVQGHPSLVSGLYWGNPITPAIQAIRDPLFYGSLPRPVDAGYAICVAVVSLVLGALVFRRVDDQLAAQI